jgi:hypothetical protein
MSSSCPSQDKREHLIQLLQQPTSKKAHISVEERADVCKLLKAFLDSFQDLLESTNKLLEDKPPLDPPLLSERTSTFALREDYKNALKSECGAITIIRNDSATKPFKFSTESSLESVMARLQELNLSGVIPFLEHVQVHNDSPGRSAEQTLVAGSDIVLDDCLFPTAILDRKIQPLVPCETIALSPSDVNGRIT